MILSRGGCDIDCHQLWVSYDNGVVWNRLSDVTVRSMVAKNNELYLTQYRYAWGLPPLSRSTDGGKTWVEIPTPIDEAGEILLGEGERLILTPHEGSFGGTSIYTSDDSGDTWDARSMPLGFGKSLRPGVHVGGGRIIFLYNSNSVFDPELFISDDNGSTWRRENPFQGVPYLGNGDGESDAVIQLNDIFLLDSGRLVILGDDGEILTSDDRGTTWIVRASQDLAELRGIQFIARVSDLAENNGFLVVPGSRMNGSISDTTPVVEISEDDGTTWRVVEIPDYAGTASAGLDGRFVLSNNDGVVLISDFAATSAGGVADFVVRESENLNLQVPRPPADGALSLRYEVTAGDAEAETDFVKTTGTLEWLESEMGAKLLTIETVDDLVQESDEQFAVDFSLDSDLIVSFTYAVNITDNDGVTTPGLEIIDPDVVVFENGDADIFRIALLTQPSSDVDLQIVNKNPAEVVIDSASLTFTPENWNQPQAVTVTAFDDSDIDSNTSTQLVISAESADEDYADLLQRTVYVVAVNDDDSPLIFSDGFEKGN